MIWFLRTAAYKGDSKTKSNPELIAFSSTYWLTMAEHAIRYGL